MRQPKPRRLWAGLCGFFFVLLLGVGAHAAERKLSELKPAGNATTKPLALKTLAGETQDLTKLKGKVVLVNFWATWCEP